MRKQDNPIGVFDSGIGGLTVLEKMAERMPEENFYYVADQGHCPYGPKSPEQVAERVRKITEHLLRQNVKAIVIACNTASLRIAAAREITDVPVISVIPPTCAKAVSLTKTKKIAVLATEATIKSGAYQNRIEQAGAEAYGLACPEFVEFLETYPPDDPKGIALVREKLRDLEGKGIDTLIHGCTHFSLLEPQMREVLGNEISYVACGDPTGEEVKKILEDRDERNNGRKGVIRLFTTGDVEKAEKLMRWFRTEHEPLRKITIE